MGQSKEIKIGEQIANAVEDHWFNPASIGYYLSQQPLWTIDRVMEIVMWVIEKNARRYEDEYGKGQTSEGLMLAYNLDRVIDKYRTNYDFKHLNFPPTKAEVQAKIDNMPPAPEEKAAARWYREEQDPSSIANNHPFL